MSNDNESLMTEADKQRMNAFQQRLDELIGDEVDNLPEGEAALKGTIGVSAILLDAAVCLLHASTGDASFVRRCVVSGTDKSLRKMEEIVARLDAEGVQ